MAVTTTLYSGRAQYYDGNIPSCVGGGADYRTVGSGKTENTYLFCVCDMSGLSSACRVSHVKVTFGSRYTLETNTAGWGNYNVKANLMMYYSMPSISGTVASSGSGAHGSTFATLTQNKVKSSTSYGSYTVEGDPTNAANQTVFGGAKGLACIHLPLSHNGNLTCRVWVNNVSFTVTRTRACYVTFAGDGITTKKVMYDFDTVPSYGSTPTRDGYIFAGWECNGTVYTSTLPTVYETDVTFTAVWQEIITPPKITDISMIYASAQIGKENKVPTGEGYLIAVGIK